LKIDRTRISPKALELKTNFRSHAGLVDPLNEMFEAIFPHDVKHASAKVDFLSSIPRTLEHPEGTYQVHSSFSTSERSSRDDVQRAESKEIVNIIRRHMPALEDARKHGKEFTIAVL